MDVLLDRGNNMKMNNEWVGECICESGDPEQEM